MKNIIKRTLTTLGAATALLLTSCIDIKQEVWINADGGGRLILDMGISKQALEMMKNLSQLGGEDAEEGNPLTQDPEKTAANLKKSEFVTDVQWQEKEDEKYKRQIYTVEISDITKIGEVLEENPLSSSLQELAGDNVPTSEDDEFSIEKTETGTYKLSAVSKGQAEEEQDPIQALMMKQMFGDAKLTVHVHAPAISHNGKEQEDGSVIWALPLGDTISGFSFKGEFEAPPIQVTIHLLAGEHFILDVKTTDTIASVKQQILARTDIPVSQQRLIQGDKELEDDRTLAGYNIQHGDSLNLIKPPPVLKTPPVPGKESGSGSNMNLLLILASVIVLLIVVMVTKAKKAKVAESLISEPAAAEEPQSTDETPESKG